MSAFSTNIEVFIQIDTTDREHFFNTRYRIRSTLVSFALILSASVALAEPEPGTDEETSQNHSSITPDVRGDELKLKLEDGNFVIVPIPISNPTLDTALVVGAAYFFPQTQEQKKSQPASVAGGGLMYSTNDSYAAAFGYESYWNKDKWRFAGAVGYADLKLQLSTTDESGSRLRTDWLLNGDVYYVHLARKIAGRWYLGGFARSIDIDQAIDFNPVESPDFDLSSTTKSSGLGVFTERDSRDMPSNAYSGSLFSVRALFNDRSIGSDNDYQSYSAEFSSYHELTDHLVLAWEVAGCRKSGTVPLWDACRIGLRGFAATDYLGKGSARSQVEARWRMSERWGLAGFAGGGYVDNGYSEFNNQELIRSYGLGLRFMVLKSKRINLRLDFAQSNNSNAVHLSVGEAF
jgi:hypothetical protein